MNTSRINDYFITGTDTEIGKTLVSCAVLHLLSLAGMSCVGMKPIAAGAIEINGVWHNEDVDQLMEASNQKCDMSIVSPYLMQAACAPHIAAELENCRISREKIQHSFGLLKAEAQAVIVEGVGGFCVPLNAEFDTADMAKDFSLPVILVVGMRLGCINHALLTAQAIAASGLRLVGWVANTVDSEMTYLNENIQALRQLLPAPLLGHIPRLANANVENTAKFLDLTLLK